MFDTGILREHTFDVATIAVGNLAVGGTGKTPHTEYILNMLSRSRRVGVLSRGYKRSTSGFVHANDHSTPNDIGDESYQIYRKFRGRNIMVAVCENRVTGIQKMLEIDPQLEVIVLDDAFQHRHVKPRVSILLTEYESPIFKDHLLPYGRLRESASGISRADIVIATKCPGNIKPIEYTLFQENLALIPAQRLFFSRFAYERLRPVFPENARVVPNIADLQAQDRILAVCGIGNPRPFMRYIKSFAPKVKVNIFPDHHAYSRSDIKLLTERFNSLTGKNNYIITTEKDAVRLMNNPYVPHELKPYIMYAPVRVEFINRDPSRQSAGPSFEDVLLRLIDSKSLIR